MKMMFIHPLIQYLKTKGNQMKYFIDRLFDVALYIMLVLFVANLIHGAV